MSLSENSEIPWEPTKHAGLLSYFDGTKRWYHCCFCAYLNDRLYHSKMHYERIHVKQGRSIPRKQKYANLSVLQNSSSGRFRTSRQMTEVTAVESIVKSEMEPELSSTHTSEESVLSEEADYMDNAGFHSPHVKVEEMVSTSDLDTSDHTDDLSTTESADSISLQDSLTASNILDSLRNIDCSNAMIFTFGDGVNSSSPFSTIGSYVCFSTRNMPQKPKKYDTSSPCPVQECSKDRDLFCEEFVSPEELRHIATELDHSELDCDSKPSVQPSPLSQSKLIVRELLESRQVQPGTNPNFHIPRSPVMADSTSSGKKIISDSEKIRIDRFSTPKTRRMLLDTSPTSTVLSCQEAGALVHDYLSGRDSGRTRRGL